MSKSIVIVGAGFGGLTAAALLSQKGHKVTLLEQGAWVGGKSRRFQMAGQTIDSGPSLVTFPQVWQKLLDKYESLGGSVENQPKFIRLPEVGRYFFRGEEIDIPIPTNHPWYRAWERFVSEHAPLEGAIAELLTSHPLDTKTLGALGKLLSVYGGRLNTEKYLNSLSWMPEGLRELIAIHTLNAGVAPDQTLPIFASVTAVMSEQGISVPAGGVNQLPQFLAELAIKSGADIQLGVKALAIRKGEVETENKTFKCDLVISAVDNELTQKLLTGKTPAPAKSRSCSGVAIYAVLKQPLPANTVTHSVVMPDNPADLYSRLKKNQQPEQTMAFVNYYNAGNIYQNTKPTVAVLLTAAADGEKADLNTPWVRKELERISKVIGLDVAIDSMFETYEILHPQYFAGIGGPLGAIYGKKNPLWQSGPFHSPSYHSLTKPWLYRVGASVHPGGGMPAVMGGAMNAIRALL
jgi:phytoene desaturase